MSQSGISPTSFDACQSFYRASPSTPSRTMYLQRHNVCNPLYIVPPLQCLPTTQAQNPRRSFRFLFFYHNLFHEPGAFYIRLHFFACLSIFLSQTSKPSLSHFGVSFLFVAFALDRILLGLLEAHDRFRQTKRRRKRKKRRRRRRRDPERGFSARKKQTIFILKKALAGSGRKAMSGFTCLNFRTASSL